LEEHYMRQTLLLTFVVSLTTSCATLQKGRDVIADAHAAVQVLKDKAAEGKAAYDAYMAKVDADRARFEMVTGPWDINGDGKVDLDEIKSLMVSTAKGAITDPAKRNILVDHWQELLAGLGTAWAAGWLGIKGAKKGVGVLLNADRAARGESDRVAS
jgi:hypothetical protein